jgi:hypothetical protein
MQTLLYVYVLVKSYFSLQNRYLAVEWANGMGETPHAAPLDVTIFD